MAAKNVSDQDDYDCLNEIAENYAKILIEIGLKRIEKSPDENPWDFVKQFLVPRKVISEFLMDSWKKKQKLKKRKDVDENLDDIFDRIQLKLKVLKDQFKKKKSELDSSRSCVDSSSSKETVKEKKRNKQEKCCCCFKIPGGKQKPDVWIVSHSKTPVKICLVPKKS